METDFQFLPVDDCTGMLHTVPNVWRWACLLRLAELSPLVSPHYHTST